MPIHRARKQHLVKGIHVYRALPRHHCRMIGPYIFLDHLQPEDIPAGQEIHVPAHAHAGLQTVTYLFSGELLHRDSLGTRQTIRPGDVNWMTAGRGIAHIEDGRASAVDTTHPLHLVQIWVGLPEAHRRCRPAFHHHPHESLPHWEQDGASIRLIAGHLMDRQSPVHTFSALLYADVLLHPGSDVTLDVSPAFECAAYVVEGELEAAGVDGVAEERELMVLPAGDYVRLHSDVQTRLLLIGGEPLDPRPVVRDNCALESLEAIERFQADYRNGRFGRLDAS